MRAKRAIRLYTTSDVARSAGVSRTLIHSYAAAGRLPVDAIIQERGGARRYLFRAVTVNSIVNDIKRQAGLSPRSRREFTGSGFNRKRARAKV